MSKSVVQNFALKLIFIPHHEVGRGILLQYLMQGFETCYTVQTCIGHVCEGNGILFHVVIAELCLLKKHTFSPFVIALVTSVIDRFCYIISVA